MIANQAKLIQETHKIAKDRLTKAAAKNKCRYDKRADARPLPTGSRVLLKHCAFTERHKLSDQYDAQQFLIIKIVSPLLLINTRISRWLLCYLAPAEVRKLGN